MKTSIAARKCALTLVELIVALGVVMLVALFVLPALAPRQQRYRIKCASNLRQIGLAWRLWANDHETEDFSFRVPVTKGGTMGSTNALRNTAWWQFAVISNELFSPRILLCPVDNAGTPRRTATSWSSTETNTGFMSLSFRDRAVSYTIGLEATAPVRQSDLRLTASNGDSMTLTSQTKVVGDLRILGTDRNIRFDGRDGTCSSEAGETEFIRVRGKSGQNPASAVWTNVVYRKRGNVLSVDGSVVNLDTKEFDTRCDLIDDNGRIHFLVPK